MDVEIEEVAKLLFSDEIPELWKDNEEFSNYVIQLSSCGVEKLGKESSHLREERLAILDQTRDLAYSNYKTFIHTADCSRTIFKDFTSVEGHLEGLASCLPSLRKSVEQFLATSRNLSQSRHLTSLTLTKHTQLLEILELPQLMDTCVRNGYYDEALEILAYVRRLERKHTDIPIISGIVTEIQAGTRLMLNQLLAQLRSPLALPQCLKVIGLLRRLDVFTEPELRLKFLQARDAWFTGIIKGIPKEDPYQHIIKVVEASRVHLFDIVTQYRAIFSDDDTRFSLGDPEVNEQAIFHGWILHKVNHFIKLVSKDLERGVGSNLESVLAQCMFFGQSFSRIGADFRNLLIPLFQKAALAQCEKDIRVANIRFDETLSSFSLMEAPETSTSSSFVETADKTRPPLTLMEFLPLAHYTNGIVAAFNTLRQCCPVGTLPQVIKLLHLSLSKVIGALVELHRLESSGFTAREEASFQRLCSVLAEGVLPHINVCLRLLYPLQQISVITGVSVAQLQRENFGQISMEELLAPIQHLIPKKEKGSVEADGSLQDMIPDLEKVNIEDPTETTHPYEFQIDDQNLSSEYVVSSFDHTQSTNSEENAEKKITEAPVISATPDDQGINEDQNLNGDHFVIGTEAPLISISSDDQGISEDQNLDRDQIVIGNQPITGNPEDTGRSLEAIVPDSESVIHENEPASLEPTVLESNVMGANSEKLEILHEPVVETFVKSTPPIFQSSFDPPESNVGKFSLEEKETEHMSEIPL
ncbi:conserved oligomeric Golgi complex component [Halocaridina rubra]|uniref:Conserved oligomeric Golgi complex subunit 8 n=1 Tax=Halocaridina rubra TaxID=373956 RepID=A0AAN8WM56_HALRR